MSKNQYQCSCSQQITAGANNTMKQTVTCNLLKVREKSRVQDAIAVIAVAPTGKASFVCTYLQTRLRDQYIGK